MVCFTTGSTDCFLARIASLTYNPPHCLDLKPFIERQEYLLRLMRAGYGPVKFSAPSLKPPPPLPGPFPSGNAPTSPVQPR